MKIEILTTFRHDTHSYFQSEVRIVPNDLGEYFCSSGWAKALDSNVQTGSSDTSEITLTIDPLDQSTISIF